MQALLDWLQNNKPLLILIVAALAALLVLQRLTRFVGRLVRAVRRRGKPVTLHPKLQNYGGHSDEEMESDRLMAGGIIATSSTASVAGYEIVRQVEAVFVEGYRTPTDATNALKAVAVRRGANAIINLLQQRSAAGKCAAQGDAVCIEPLVSKARPAGS
ncbi:MAG: hypothetical protein KF841_16520 [Phycisphaerae bacterium]|nr:hypothetical protein [Phycisphaerae bacterium]